MIKPDFWSDPKMSNGSTRDARLLYIALWNFSDDYGNIKGNSVWLKNQIFPYDEILLVDFEAYLKELETLGRIKKYEHNCEEYYHIVNFLKHQYVQHPSKQKNPPPTFDENINGNTHEDYHNGTTHEDYDSPHEGKDRENDPKSSNNTTTAPLPYRNDNPHEDYHLNTTETEQKENIIQQQEETLPYRNDSPHEGYHLNTTETKQKENTIQQQKKLLLLFQMTFPKQLTEKDFLLFKRTYGLEAVQERLEALIEKDKSKKGSVKNAGGYLRKSLEGPYPISVSEKEPPNVREAENEVMEAAENKKTEMPKFSHECILTAVRYVGWSKLASKEIEEKKIAYGVFRDTYTKNVRAWRHAREKIPA